MKLSFNRGRAKIDEKVIANALLFIYLCLPFVKRVLQAIISLMGFSFDAYILILTVMMMVYVFLCVWKRKLFVPEFWAMYLVMGLLFFFTFIMHPEYEYWFTRSDYGVWAYVLRPNNGVFIYLFLRLVNDPKRIEKTVKWSAWPMYVYYMRSVAQALARGYWIDTSNRGYEIHMSYNLSLGYNVLLFALMFLYAALEEKKLSDWIGASIGIGLILVAGSRGPFLDIGIFVLIYILLKMARSRKKIAISLGVIVGFSALWAVYPYLLAFLSSVFSRAGISSRFITKLLSGEIVDDSGRTRIWAAAVDMIRQNPWGYGAMGSRHVIAQYIYVAHPHQFFLEILIDFGVIAGSIIIAWLLLSSIRLFTAKGKDLWKGMFLVFFGRACQLLVSLTFWHSIGLWGAIAIGVCMHLSGGRKR